MAKRRKNKTGLISNIIFSVIALIALTLCIVLLLLNYSMKNEMDSVKAENEELSEYSSTHIYTEDELVMKLSDAKKAASEEEKDKILDGIRDRMENGYTAFGLLKELFTDEVVVPADEGYAFFPITDEYRHNDYILDNFRKNEDTGEVTYTDGNENVISHKGIDVSRYNGQIDWSKVKNDGVEFAIIRVGYRGSSEGKLVMDDTFESNIKGALNNGIRVGVYFFTQAISADEGREEAEFLLDAIKDYDVTYPVVLDVESYEGGRGDKIDKDSRTDAAIAFLETVKDAGYSPMLYANLKGYFIMLDMARIEEYDKWFAYYQYPVYMPYKFKIWQYSAKGRVAGIKGDCDLNIWFD